MILRPATRDDAQRLYEWRTNPATEAMSLTPGPASFEEHLRWLDRVLADLRVKLYIAEDGGTAVGTGRLNIDGPVAELSVTVAPAVRGRGYGTEIVDALVSQARELGLQRVVARVLGNNVPSLVAFLHNRFVPEGTVIRMERAL